MSEAGDLIVHERPELKSPRMVVAFGGWPDAAAVATKTVSSLVEQLGATRFAEIPGDDFYSPAVLRPTTSIKNGRVESLTYPTNQLHYWRNPGDSGDLIFMAGIEPHLHWNRYLAALMTVASDLGVTVLYSLGGLYDNVPHTRPVRISAVVEDEGIRGRLAGLGVIFTEYEGPSSLHTALLVECRNRGIPTASLWGHSPSYAQLSWNPRVSAALAAILARLLEIEVDLEPLRVSAGYLDEALDKLARQNPQVRALISRFEESYGAAPEPSQSLPPISESIVSEIEEILRRGEGTPDEGEGSSPDNEPEG